MLRSAGASRRERKPMSSALSASNDVITRQSARRDLPSPLETTEQRSSQVNTVSPGPLAFIEIQMQGVTTEAFIDTSSSVNIMDTALYERIGGVIQLCERALTQPKMRLRDFSRNTLSVKAQVTVKVEIAEISWMLYLLSLLGQNRLAY